MGGGLWTEEHGRCRRRHDGLGLPLLLHRRQSAVCLFIQSLILNVSRVQITSNHIVTVQMPSVKRNGSRDTRATYRHRQIWELTFVSDLMSVPINVFVCTSTFNSYRICNYHTVPTSALVPMWKINSNLAFTQLNRWHKVIHFSTVLGLSLNGIDCVPPFWKIIKPAGTCFPPHLLRNSNSTVYYCLVPLYH